MPTVDATLADLVTDQPGRAAVLDRLGLDYCCHGQRRLDQACADAGLDAAEVLAALDTAAPVSDEAPTEPAALVDHIESTHHRYLHEELPALGPLAHKVASVHGEHHAELAEVRDVLDELVDDLLPHLLKEERVLFPAIRALAGGERDFPFGTIRNPIRMMSFEHDRAGELLARLRELTGGYAVPDDGCASYRSLYERLEAVEVDTHRHIHLENNVLFPAARALEDA